MGAPRAKRVDDRRELLQILELQRANLARNLTPQEMASQGFVTVEHTLEVLERMHALSPSIVAKDEEALAGYALVMPLACRRFIPVLEPMFVRLAARGLLSERSYVMGQICVARPWRGKGVFDLLYRAHRDLLSADYDRALTEVATRNARSMRAHQRVGFRIVERYRDATDEWALLRWDFSDPVSAAR